MPQMPPLDDAGLRELLSQPLVAKLATSSSKGDIRITPMWFRADDDGSIVFNTWEETAAGRNLSANPRCSVLVDSRDWPYIGAHFWGTAAVEGPEDDTAGIAAMFEPYLGGQMDATEYANMLIGWGKRVYIRFRPERKTTWDFRQG